MPTFVEDVQAIDDGNAAEFGRLLAGRIEALGEALDRLEAWTEASRETRAELSSKYETAKSFARDEIREATDEAGVEDIPTEELLDHPAVGDQTKDQLREYSTKLFVYLDEEQSYGEARAELLSQLDAELDLYKRLLGEVETGETSVRAAQRAIAAFARDETLGPANRTAVDVVLESSVDDAA